MRPPVRWGRQAPGAEPRPRPLRPRTRGLTSDSSIRTVLPDLPGAGRRPSADLAPVARVSRLGRQSRSRTRGAFQMAERSDLRGTSGRPGAPSALPPFASASLGVRPAQPRLCGVQLRCTTESTVTSHPQRRFVDRGRPAAQPADRPVLGATALSRHAHGARPCRPKQPGAATPPAHVASRWRDSRCAVVDGLRLLGRARGAEHATLKLPRRARTSA
jgi:hypothetical protein